MKRGNASRFTYDDAFFDRDNVGGGILPWECRERLCLQDPEAHFGPGRQIVLSALRETSQMGRVNTAVELPDTGRAMPLLFRTYLLGISYPGSGIRSGYDSNVRTIWPDSNIRASLDVFPTHVDRRDD